MAHPTDRDAVLEPILILQLYVNKLKNETLLLHIRVDTLLIVRSYYKRNEKEPLSIHKYIQTLTLVYAYHSLNIDLLTEAAIKHYLWKTEHNFKAEELDSSKTLSKECKKILVK